MIAERGKQRQRSRSAVPAISTEPPTCQNVRGGTRLKTIQLPGVVGAFTNFYGPSKRVLRQIWPDGTEIRFNYKVVGGCVPGLTSHTAQPTEGTPLAGGSNTQGKGDAPLCLLYESWSGKRSSCCTCDLADGRRRFEKGVRPLFALSSLFAL